MGYTLNLIQKIVCIHSIFPTEVFEEMEDIEFDSFNKEDGSYQIIIPKLLHFVHQSLTQGLSYAEYLVVKSAFLSGSVDSVFIHSVGSPNSSYLDILLEDRTLEDKLFISDVNPGYDDELDKITSQQATSIGLMGIASFGGFFVQPNTLFMGDITKLLKYESFVYWNDQDDILPSIIGAHPSAKVIEQIKALGGKSFPDIDVALDLFGDSENVKRISEKKLLTKINGNSSFVRTLENKLVDLNQDGNLDNYTEISVKTALSLEAALLRKIQYNTYRLILD